MIVVKPARKDDSKEIFTWRNNRITREMSITTEAVNWEGHEIWFENILKDENRLLLMCILEETNEKVSVVRFDIDGERAIVSINLSPPMRGKRLAKSCLTESIKYLMNHKVAVNCLHAEIKLANHASIAAFKKVGFLLVSEGHDLCQFEYRF